MIINKSTGPCRTWGWTCSLSTTPPKGDPSNYFEGDRAEGDESDLLNMNMNLGCSSFQFIEAAP
jgi:hypothetical protein